MLFDVLQMFSVKPVQPIATSEFSQRECFCGWFPGGLALSLSYETE